MAYCCCLVFLIAVATSVVRTDDFTLQRRTDDATLQSLVSMVEQQASVIQHQESMMQAMQNQITALQATVTNMNSTLDHLTTKLIHAPVSFMAQTTPTPIFFSASGSPLKFDKVITNFGGGYHPVSGVFIAPVSGLYVFYVQLMKHANEHVIHYIIDLEGTEVCENSLDEALAYDKSSCLTTVHVQSDQQVFVRLRANVAGVALEGNVWCSFAGFLLSAD